MLFPKSETVTAFTRSFFKENIKKFIDQRKEIIFFPKDTAEQMANLVSEYVEDVCGLETSLSKTSKGVFILKVTYPEKLETTKVSLTKKKPFKTKKVRRKD